MRFNFKKWGVLKIIQQLKERMENGDAIKPFKYPILIGMNADPESCKNEVGNAFKIIQKSDIFYISNTIVDFIFKEKRFVKSTRDFIFNEDLSFNGIFLVNGYALCCEYIKSDGIHECVCYVFKDQNIFVGVAKIDFSQGSNGLLMSSGYNEMLLSRLPYLKDIPVESFLRECLFLIAFKKFAPIEFKVINSTGHKKAYINGEKHLNEIPLDITVIDSNWITTIIRTEGFNVRGHFAIRACGKNRKDRRLVWINSYRKNGYIRMAKKLNA